MMVNHYIVNGKVARDKIAMDVKYRKLTRDSIAKICRDSQIKSSFIGTHYDDKRPKTDWNKDYLNRLSYAVVAESFNLDYLLYLDEVAEYVSKTTPRYVSKTTPIQVVVAGGIILFLIILGVILY